MSLYFYVIEVHVFTTPEMDTLCYFTHRAICVIIYDCNLQFSISIFGAELCIRFSSPFWSPIWGTSQPKLHVQFSSGSNWNRKVKYCYISMALASLISEISALMFLYKRKWIPWISSFRPTRNYQGFKNKLIWIK